MTLAEIDVPHALVRVLEEAGIEFVFGMPGGDTGRIFDALYDSSSITHDPRAPRADRLGDGRDVRARHRQTRRRHGPGDLPRVQRALRAARGRQGRLAHAGARRLHGHGALHAPGAVPGGHWRVRQPRPAQPLRERHEVHGGRVGAQAGGADAAARHQARDERQPRARGRRLRQPLALRAPSRPPGRPRLLSTERYLAHGVARPAAADVARVAEALLSAPPAP